MKRREFITLLGGAAVAWPLGARAQQATTPVVGFLNSQAARGREHLVAAFQRGLDSFGQDVAVEYHWADGSTERLTALSDELVRRQVSVIVATGGFISGLAAGSDPVKIGLVSNFNHPGGNITGISFFITELEAKRVELLRDLVPSAKSIAYLANPRSRTVRDSIANVQSAVNALGLQIQVIEAGTRSEIEQAFERLPQYGMEAVIIHSDPFYVNRRAQIVALAARYRVPAIYSVREFATGGGLISYGTSQPDAYYQAGLYAARILKGEKPGDLPVIRPTKFELVINLKTAKALGLTIPPTLLARADEVIE